MKEKISHIAIKDYDYPLPEEKIPNQPVAVRDQSKLLLYQNEKIDETIFENISSYIPENSLLVYNHTKVICARLFFEVGTHQIQVMCLEPIIPHDHQLNLAATQKVVWKCLVGNNKKWKSGTISLDVFIDDKKVQLTIERGERIIDAYEVSFSWDNNQMTFGEILAHIGNIPLPPYFNRNATEEDRERYQTFYALKEGSVAAPTAGLHFTEKVFNSLDQKGVERCAVTLHVGAGTFKPVKSELIGGHEMHAERFVVTREVIAKLKIQKEKGLPVVAVGTTSMRTLESLFWLGIKIKNESTIPVVEQWEPYESNTVSSSAEAFAQLLNYMDKNGLEEIDTYTSIIIAPGYTFKVVDALITNFHQPCSTLLLLISAFVGDEWKRIYDYALNNEFRFLSYGDSSLLWKK